MVNKRLTNLMMKIGEVGEAYFVQEAEGPVPEALATSPIGSPMSSPPSSPTPVSQQQTAITANEVEIVVPTIVSQGEQQPARSLLTESLRVQEEEAYLFKPITNGEEQQRRDNQKNKQLKPVDDKLQKSVDEKIQKSPNGKQLKPVDDKLQKSADEKLQNPVDDKLQRPEPFSPVSSKILPKQQQEKGTVMVGAQQERDQNAIQQQQQQQSSWSWMWGQLPQKYVTSSAVPQTGI